MAENVNVKITMQGGGEIELELYPDIAPISFANATTSCTSGHSSVAST